MKFQRAWGFLDDDGTVMNVTDTKRPRKTGRGTYTNAFHALGFKPVRVVILKESDFNTLVQKRRAVGKKAEQP